MKETLIIYRDWWEAIKELPTDLQLPAFTSICEYAFEGIQPQDPMICAVTALMRSAIDRDKAKWEEVREKRRAAGSRGAQSTNKKRWGTDTPEESAKSANADTCRQMPTPSQEEHPQPSNTDKEALSHLEAEFDKFRQLYPGSKRGLAVEFSNLKKKYPKTWKEIVPLLCPALERLIAYHKDAEAAIKQGAKIFLPNYAYLSSWINNARWEEEYPAITIPGVQHTPTTTEEAEPETDFGGMDY